MNSISSALRPILPLLLAAFLCSAAWVMRPMAWGAHLHTDLLTHTVYAYRQWQSTGLMLQPGDRVLVEADGEWLYSPVVGENGPDGGLPAPSTYPLPGANGGALLGRIGEAGPIILVGRRRWIEAREPGMLYLRINDDLLGDNRGDLAMTLRIGSGQTD